jgi:hypothetical protein
VSGVQAVEGGGLAVAVHAGGNPMKATVCPMCRGDRWFDGVMGNPVTIWLTFFRRVPLKCRVCLACGFVAPYVDGTGLARIMAEAKGDGDER